MCKMQWKTLVLAVAFIISPVTMAAVPAEQAAALKTTLTPFGAERAANKEGTIPIWDGGTKIAPFTDGKIPDPFATEKPLFSINPQNVDKYGDKLSDGVKALMTKYPSTFRVDVYPTHRTASAPQWVYDNTFQNATRAHMNPSGSLGAFPVDAYGGIPFPIAKTGEEAIWNHQLRWAGQAVKNRGQAVRMTPDGKMVVVQQTESQLSYPYYRPDWDLQKWQAEGSFFVTRRVNTVGPPIRAGEATVARSNIDDSKSMTYTYLTGQRRVRRLPLSCCDIPNPISGGIANFDELSVWFGSIGRYDWKLVGKREMYIPYNNNKYHQPANLQDVLGANHPNPDLVRYELHRVWVVDATLKPGERHSAPKARFYLDEDTWMAVLGDRWDAQGNLWKATFNMPTVMSSAPAVVEGVYLVFDLAKGGYYAGTLNLANVQGKAMEYLDTPFPDRSFTAEALSGEGVR